MADPLHVLVIDDEPQIRRFLRLSLAAEGMHADEAGTGAEGLQLARSAHPELIILDLGLPDADGLAVIPKIREFTAVPIVVLSVRNDDASKVQALDAGADDYLVKPFSVAELLARIRAAMRHRLQQQGALPIVDLGELKIDLVRRKVMLRDEEVKLSRKEYAILALLAQHVGKVVTQPQILREVWGKVHEADTQYLRVYVGQLRDKLGDDALAPRYIETEPGVGYRLLSGARSPG
ncbi:MAG: response regulator transcription factor [Sinimarinibacterium sp.]|jgi:two-component system KDP operon response regulator KdpE